MAKRERLTFVTYIHPISGKRLTDRVLHFDPKNDKITVDRSSPHSTLPLVINPSQVLNDTEQETDFTTGYRPDY